jgi:Holliday junction resolvasome RuvABC endonuclease subunit
MIAILTMMCERRHIEYIPVGVSTIKYAAGYGKFSKDEMLASAKAKWDIEIPDHNAADALWILHCLTWTRPS